MPLVWLLVLIAMGAVIWYLANRSDRPEVPVGPVGPAAPVTGPTAPEPEDDRSSGPADAVTPAAATPAPAAPATSDRDATPLAQVHPEYPAAALRSREEGTVLLRVEVDAQGNPASVEVERSSRSRDLDRAARQAVRKWTFQPATEDGRPVASTVTVPVDFRIGEQ